MKKQLFILLLCFAFVFRLSAQTSAPAKGVITGTVMDSVKNEPLAFVTVLLKDIKTNQPEKSVLTKDNGTFEISAPVNKSYQVVFAFIGYKSKTITIPAFGNKALIGLGKTLLAETRGQLKEVSITASRPIIKQEVDRIAYDVQADPESKALSALDMMRKVPLLSVDANDNIKLKGNGNYKILINGKESALMAKNPSDVLKSMPGTNIEKIEVITTPPAKYDAEGLAGIINIITKKNADQGYNGSINGRMNSVWGPGINLNATIKQGKFGLSGFVGTSKDGNNNDGFNGSTQTFVNKSVLTQNGSYKNGGTNTYGNLEASYEIDTLNLLTASYQFFGGHYSEDGDQFTNQLNSTGFTTQQYLLDYQHYSKYSGLDASLNYQLGFKHDKNQLLTLSYKYSYSPNSQANTNAISDTVKFPQPSYIQNNTAGTKEHTIQLDYVQPLNKTLNIEAGGKAILRNNYSDFESDNFNSATNTYLASPTQTNTFNYQQDVYSLYNSYQLKLEKWTVKAGLRVEHTGIDFVSNGSTITPNYNNLIPSVSAQHSFSKSSLTFGYTQRILRPGISQLNPFVNKQNPDFVTTGNPNLHPELSNTFELNYSNFAKSAITIGLSYAFSNNSIQNVTNISTQLVSGKLDTVTTTTYQNVGSNKNLGLNANLNLNPVKNFSISVNALVSHIWLKGDYNGKEYTNAGFGSNTFASFSYKFDSGYRLGFNSGYFTSDVLLQGRTGAYLYTSYLVGKDLLDKKATISLVANNPYSRYFTQNTTTNTADFSQSTFNRNPYASFAVRFNYRFGRLNSEIKKNQRGINNDDTKGGGAKTTGS